MQYYRSRASARCSQRPWFLPSFLASFVPPIRSLSLSSLSSSPPRSLYRSPPFAVPKATDDTLATRLRRSLQRCSLVVLSVASCLVGKTTTKKTFKQSLLLRYLLLIACCLVGECSEEARERLARAERERESEANGDLTHSHTHSSRSIYDSTYRNVADVARTQRGIAQSRKPTLTRARDGDRQTGGLLCERKWNFARKASSCSWRNESPVDMGAMWKLNTGQNARDPNSHLRLCRGSECGVGRRWRKNAERWVQLPLSLEGNGINRRNVGCGV